MLLSHKLIFTLITAIYQSFNAAQIGDAYSQEFLMLKVLSF